MVSQADILTQRGMTLTLGNETKEYPPLTIGRARKWREELFPVIARIIEERELEIAKPEDLKLALLDSPMDMAKIVAGYVGMELDAFLDTVTEHELGLAFNPVMQEAVIPFFQREGMKKGLKIGLAMSKATKLQETPTTSPSPNGG